MVFLCIHFDFYVIYFLGWGVNETTVCPMMSVEQSVE
jgi:hypothetical protein